MNYKEACKSLSKEEILLASIMGILSQIAVSGELNDYGRVRIMEGLENYFFNSGDLKKESKFEGDAPLFDPKSEKGKSLQFLSNFEIENFENPPESPEDFVPL